MDHRQYPRMWSAQVQHLWSEQPPIESQYIQDESARNERSEVVT